MHGFTKSVSLNMKHLYERIDNDLSRAWHYKHENFYTFNFQIMQPENCSPSHVRNTI